jgi:Flp pilus assembly protein TadG
MSRHRRADDGPDRGQALVEFSLAFVVFIFLLMALFDFGRAVYTYNGVSEAARDIARAAAVSQGTTGYSTSAQTRINTQKALVPGLTVLDPVCVNSADASTASAVPGPCPENSFLVVTARATYTPGPLLGFLGTIQLQSNSRIQVPLSQNK